MEQVTLSPLPSSAFFRGNQALVLQNNQNLNFLSDDIIQQALNGINTQVPTLSDLEPQNINLDQNSFIFSNDGMINDERVVQLSIPDSIPLQLSFKTGDNVLNTKQQEDVPLEDILRVTNDKSDNSLDSINNLLQLSPDIGTNEVQDLFPSNVKGNFTYAYQLTNGKKLNPVLQNIVPIVTSNITPQLKMPVDDSKTVSENSKPAKFFILKNVNVNSKVLLNVNKPVPDVTKNNVQQVLLISSAPQPVVNKNPRTIAPHRMAIPPLKKPKLKEGPPQSHVILATQSQDLKLKSIPTLTSLTPYLKPKSTEISSTTKNNGNNRYVYIFKYIYSGVIEY